MRGDLASTRGCEGRETVGLLAGSLLAAVQPAAV